MVLPAYAGMILPPTGWQAHYIRAPRVCGDDPLKFRSPYYNAACSPRMRG